MINSSYTVLGNKVTNSGWQVNSASQNASVKGTSTQADTTYAGGSNGVVLTLSGQEEFVSLKSVGAVTRTTAASSTVLKVGSTGTAVSTLQKNLTKLGYDTKGTDGIFGNNTKAAVIEFQKAYGLTADGIVGNATQNAITKALNYHNQGLLTVGSRGTKVTELQKNLTKLGYNTNGIDGIFGAGTQNAVIAFQRANGLTQDGIVGSATQNAIKKALESADTTPSNPTGNTAAIQKMLDNLKNDTSLGLSSDKKTAMVKAAERLLNDGYEVAFVAGVLGNIQSEGTPGIFESSNYSSNPSAKPAYLKYMDTHFDYRNKFSGRTIREVGVSAAVELAKAAKASGYAGKFGLGMIQWTGSRTLGLLESYQKYASSDKPTMEECITAEVNFMADELEGTYSYVYSSWKAGDRTASSAGDIVCRKYEIPSNTSAQAKIRAANATKIYNVMMK